MNKAYTASSFTNGMLKKPTSCPTLFFFVSGISPVLHPLPNWIQSWSISWLPRHSCTRSCIAYRLAGKNPDVHAFGCMRIHSPVVRDVTWGYAIGWGWRLAKFRNFASIRGENTFCEIFAWEDWAEMADHKTHWTRNDSSLLMFKSKEKALQRRRDLNNCCLNANSD